MVKIWDNLLRINNLWKNKCNWVTLKVYSDYTYKFFLGIIIFSFSEPIIIEFDVLEEKNKDFFIQLLQDDEKLVKQLTFFIRKFRELESQGKILDLYGWENLVYAKDDKLRYIDNYVVFAQNETVINASLRKIKYLEDILTIITQ